MPQISEQTLAELANKLTRIHDLQVRQPHDWSKTATYTILTTDLLDVLKQLLEEALKQPGKTSLPRYKVIESYGREKLEKALNQIGQRFTVVGQVHLPAARTDCMDGVLTTIQIDDTPTVD
jgi:hypothetical protein